MNGAVTLSPSSLPADTINVAYNQTITAGGGTGTIGLVVSNIQNAIPGLTLPASGTGSLVISGTPTATGTETFTVTATDSVGAQKIINYAIVVNQAISFSPPSLPPDTINIAYNETITASGGVGPYVFAIISGWLPPGLTFSSTGTISGTPTVAGEPPLSRSRLPTPSTEQPPRHMASRSIRLSL